MDNPCWSSGFERGDLNPPVPAPRYKRKLITTEDSKHTSNKQNTSMNEHAVNIMPPPRRKNRSQTYQQTNTLVFTFEDIESSIFQKDIEKDNRVKYLLDCSADTEKNYNFSSLNLTACNKNDIFEESVHHSDNLSQEEIFAKGIELASEVKGFQEKTHVDKYLELDKVINTLDTNTNSNESEKYDAFEESSASNIFEKFIEDRVVGIPLETTEGTLRTSPVEQQPQNFDQDKDTEKNRVHNSFSENSATIVGVYYKPEYSSLGEISKDALVNQMITNELDSVFRLSSRSDDGNKTTIIVPMCESKKVNNKIITKDSEEDDSGVYFSDTKSPPHRGINVENNISDLEKESKPMNKDNELEFYKTFSCNNGDTFDNKTQEDLGPQNYRKMLDHFEAQTVNAFHEEIFTRLSLNDEEINKNKVVEDWLDSGEYLSKKKNSSFSQYLKTMLEPESSVGSLSPYPLSVLDEDDRSDNFSDDLKGSKEIEEVDKRNSILQTSTVSSSLKHTHENRSVDPSDNIGFIVDMNNVNKHNVYNDCIKVTPNDYECLNTSDKFNSYTENFEFFEGSFVDLSLSNSDCNVLPERGNGLQSFVAKLVELEDYDDDYKDNTNDEQDEGDYCNTTSTVGFCPLNAQDDVLIPTIKHGVVNSLVAYFEAINNQEEEPSCENGFALGEEVESASVSDHDNNDNINKLETLTQLNSSIFSNIPTDVNFSERSFESQEKANNQFHFEDDNFQSDTNGITAKKTRETEDLLKDSFNCSVADEIIKEKARLSFEDLQNTENTIFENKIESIQNTITIDMLNGIGYDVGFEEHIDEEQTWPIVTESDKLCDKSFDSVSASNYIVNVENNLEVKSEKEKDSPSVSPDEDFSISSDILNEYADKIKEPHECDDYSELNCTRKMIDPTASYIFKPTRIPVIVLSETDVRLSPVGSIELHPAESILQNNEGPDVDCSELSEENSVDEVRTLPSCNQTNYQCVFPPANMIDVALEKNWGSIGLKIKGDGNGVIVSDILPGGSADSSGLVFKGWVDIKSMKEEMEIFC